jgi:hypothetical protein
MTAGSRFGAGAGSAEWRILWDANFTTEPAQLTPADADYAIAGATVKKRGTVNTRGANTGINAGVGLIPGTNAGTIPNVDVFTRSTFVIPVKQFFADLTILTPLRLTYTFTAETVGDASNDVGLFGSLGTFELAPSVHRNAACFGMRFKNNPATKFEFNQYTSIAGSGGSVTPSSNTDAVPITWQTMRITMPQGAYAGRAILECSTSNARWPADSAFTFVTAIDLFSKSIGDTNAYSLVALDPQVWTPDAIACELGGYANGAGVWQPGFTQAKIEIYR